MRKSVLSAIRSVLLLLTAFLLFGGVSFAADSAAQSLSKTTLVSVKSKEAGKITVKWKENSSGKGYEIQYSTDKSFQSGTKSKIVKHSTTVVKVLKGLTQNKTYYVRIRTKKGDKHSGWSKKKKVKVKGDSGSGGGSGGSSGGYGGDIVYLTPTGKKYHRLGCWTVGSDDRAVSRSQAIAEGYGACGICHP